MAFCIRSVISYPLRDGPIKITGLIEGTTSYGGIVSIFWNWYEMRKIDGVGKGLWKLVER